MLKKWCWSLSQWVSQSVSQWVTRSPIELFWTAKNVFGEMNLSKCICPNIFVQMYFSKCICKMYLSNCICQNVFFSCLSISLIKCLKGQKCLGLLFNVKNQKWLSQWVTQWLSEWQGHLLSCSGQLKSLTKQTNPCKTWAHTELAKFYIINNKIVPNGSRKNKVLIAWE